MGLSIPSIKSKTTLIMGKYNQYEQTVRDVFKQHPDWGSDKIAEHIVRENKLLISASNLARHIRHRKLLQQHTHHHTPLKQAKVLLFDIETAPMLSYHFGLWGQNIRMPDVYKEGCILTWSAKWLFSEEIIQEKITPKEVVDRNDERIVKKLWKLLDECDIAIGHNVNKFDKKVANQRFLRYGMPPPSFYETIDTLLHSRKQFKQPSHRLDDICRFLGIDGKVETPKGLWRDAVEGDAEAIRLMAEYCDNDVKILEDVYLAMRAYIKPHPNIGLLENPEDGYCCPTCGGHEFKFDGEYRTYVNVYDNLRCTSCGSLQRSRTAKTPKEVRDRLLVSNPK